MEQECGRRWRKMSRQSSSSNISRLESELSSSKTMKVSRSFHSRWGPARTQNKTFYILLSNTLLFSRFFFLLPLEPSIFFSFVLTLHSTEGGGAVRATSRCNKRLRLLLHIMRASAKEFNSMNQNTLRWDESVYKK